MPQTSTPRRLPAAWLRLAGGAALTVTVLGLAVATAGATTSAPPAPRVAALAALTIPINPGNVPTTAVGHEDQECSPIGPVDGQDGWVFVLPGNKATFVSLTLTFATPTGQVVLTIPTDGGAIVTENGTSKAWIRTPAGWTLTGGSAQINGTSASGNFNLTHTCPAPSASPSPSESETGSPSPSESGTASPSASDSESPSPSASESTPASPPGDTESPSASATVPGEGGGSRLPTTGLALGGLLALGLGLVGAGLGMQSARRRRGSDESVTLD